MAAYYGGKKWYGIIHLVCFARFSEKLNPLICTCTFTCKHHLLSWSFVITLINIHYRSIRSIASPILAQCFIFIPSVGIEIEHWVEMG